jgi:hypothetical protein
MCLVLNHLFNFNTLTSITPLYGCLPAPFTQTHTLTHTSHLLLLLHPCLSLSQHTAPHTHLSWLYSLPPRPRGIAHAPLAFSFLYRPAVVGVMPLPLPPPPSSRASSL